MKIKRFSSFYSVFYAIEWKGKRFLIDCGSPFDRKRIEQEVKRIDYIFITHGHWDHAGNALFLKKEGAKIFIHEKDFFLIKNRIIHVPPPRKSLYSYFLFYTLNFLKKFAKVEYFEKDDLKNIEEVEIIETPGHTHGSCTYKIKDNYFIGDILIGPNPFIKRPRLSFLIEDKNVLKKTLELLFEFEGKFYPGHGKVFSSYDLKKARDFIWRDLKVK
ncbi:MAG: MBL fold metallo-hydrolase [Candidatus Hydrothermales bacterium]